MRHGIGTTAQTAALIAAGAERVTSPTVALAVLADKEIAPTCFRKGDTVVMVQPNIMLRRDLARIAKLTPMFEVIGHAPVDCSTDQGLGKFRELVAVVDAIEPVNRGGNLVYRQPTRAEIAVIIGYWHGSMKPREFMPIIREMMGEPELAQTWARDLVKKHTGNTKRDADAPGKRSFSIDDRREQG